MPAQEVQDRSISELVQEGSQQTATLVRDEIRLAQLELQEKGKHAGIGAGMFGGAGAVALFGAGALIAAIPKAFESEYGWREVLPAAAAQGAVFGLAKADVDRGGAQSFEKLTGVWPGD